jgi:hypothetical protein
MGRAASPTSTDIISTTIATTIAAEERGRGGNGGGVSNDDALRLCLGWHFSRYSAVKAPTN